MITSLGPHVLHSCGLVPHRFHPSLAVRRPYCGSRLITCGELPHLQMRWWSSSSYYLFSLYEHLAGFFSRISSARNLECVKMRILKMSLTNLLSNELVFLTHLDSSLSNESWEWASNRNHECSRLSVVLPSGITLKKPSDGTPDRKRCLPERCPTEVPLSWRTWTTQCCEFICLGFRILRNVTELFLFMLIESVEYHTALSAWPSCLFCTRHLQNSR